MDSSWLVEGKVPSLRNLAVPLDYSFSYQTVVQQHPRKLGRASRVIAFDLQCCYQQSLFDVRPRLDDCLTKKGSARVKTSARQSRSAVLEGELVPKLDSRPGFSAVPNGAFFL